MTHHKYLVNSGDLLVKRRERTRQETLQMIHHELFRQIEARLCEDNQIEEMVEAIMDHKLNPYNVVEQVVSKWLPSLKKDK
jgi:LAO/AO transport system kinase